MCVCTIYYTKGLGNGVFKCKSRGSQKWTKCEQQLDPNSNPASSCIWQKIRPTQEIRVFCTRCRDGTENRTETSNHTEIYTSGITLSLFTKDNYIETEILSLIALKYINYYYSRMLKYFFIIYIIPLQIVSVYTHMVCSLNSQRYSVFSVWFSVSHSLCDYLARKHNLSVNFIKTNQKNPQSGLLLEYPTTTGFQWGH